MRQAGLLAIAERFPEVYCSVGTHPHYAHEELELTVADLVARTRHAKTVAIGEAGLDRHYDFSPIEAQARGFSNHIAAARRDRAAAHHSFARCRRRHGGDPLEEETGKAFPAVLRASPAGAIAQRHRVFISFTGILTFRNRLRAIAPRCRPTHPVETDALILRPPSRRANSYFVVETPSAGRDPHVPFGGARGRPPRNFFRSTAKRGAPRSLQTLTLTIPAAVLPGCAPGARLQNAIRAIRNRRRRCSLPVRRANADGSAPGPGAPRPICASGALTPSRRPTASCSLRARRPHPWDRRSSRPVPAPPAPPRCLPRRADLSDRLFPFRLLLRQTAGQHLPANP